MSGTDAGGVRGKEMARFLRHVSGRDAASASPKAPEAGRANGRGSGSRKFRDEVVAAALARGLVRRMGDGYRIDAAGRAWLRRWLVDDSAEPYGAQHRDTAVETVEIAGGRNRVSRNLAESPLSALMRMKTRDGRPFLGDEAFRAGERLRRDFTRGQLQPRVSSNWEAGVSGGRRAANGAAEISDVALAARQRVALALDAVGPELSGVLLDVCCFLKGLETVERERQWPARSGKLMLKTALLSLARHYAPPQANERRHGPHRWGAPGYRPEIDVRRP